MHRFENYKLMLDEAGQADRTGTWRHGYHLQSVRCRSQMSRNPEGDQRAMCGRRIGSPSVLARGPRRSRQPAPPPNVASMFHLGRSDTDYFYAMEFVEGETLESLIKTFRPSKCEAGIRNYDAGWRRLSGGAPAEASSSGHQTDQHYGAAGRRRGNRGKKSSTLALPRRPWNKALKPQFQPLAHFVGTPEFREPGAICRGWR